MKTARFGVLLLATTVASCTSFGVLDDTGANGPGRAHDAAGQPLDPQAAYRAVASGGSTPDDVRRALGPAIVIPFDSGYQVWVYRWPGADRTTRSATELVLLFDPSGVVTKTRLRPGYPSAD